jgi:hypothetical protein
MKRKGREQIGLVLGIFCLCVILPCAGYGASLTIGKTVSVNGNMDATSFSGDGSGLTNVGGNSSCTPITSLPTTITAPGYYCLTSDLATNMTSGAAITINTDDVVLDLNGFKLDGLAAGTGTLADGIRADYRQNITIRNGTVRGFFEGIVLIDPNFSGISRGHVVEYIRADQNRYTGIRILGIGVIIRNNQVLNTGGSTYVHAYGISVSGNGARVLNNDVIDTVDQGGTSYGILFFNSFGSFAVNNRISWADVGIEFFAAGAGAFGKYRDNLTYGVVTPFIGGTPVGIND